MGASVSTSGKKRKAVLPPVADDEVLIWGVVHKREVTELRLQNPPTNTRSQKLPKELTLVPNLKKLEIERNSYLVGGLGVLKEVPCLERFTARRSMLDGTLEPIGECPKLEVFDISYTEVKGNVDCLAKCTKLRRCVMQECNRICGSFEVFGKLEFIEEIVIDSCQGNVAGSLEPLRVCKHLRVLCVSLLVEGSLEPLTACKELRKVWLTRTKLRGSYKPLAELVKLKDVKLEAHINLNGSLSVCKKLDQLQRLFLGTTSGELSPLKNCPRMERLTIENPVGKLNGPLSALSSLGELKHLLLTNCQYLEGNLDALASCPMLEKIDLRGCLLLTGDVEPLGNCKELQYLNVDRCPGLTGNVVDRLGSLPKLTELLGEGSGLEGLDLFEPKVKEPVCGVEMELLGESWWRAVVASMQGWRPTLEDAQFVVPSLSTAETREYTFFAVLDGHGGKAAAVDAAEILPLELVKRINKDPAVLEGAGMDEKIVDCYVRTDEKLQKDPELRKKIGRSGSTCATAALRRSKDGDGYEGWIANAGDSRGLLVRMGEGNTVETIVASADHKPHREDELKRIEEAGGFVTNVPNNKSSGILSKLSSEKTLRKKQKKPTPRVDGNLAVSRGFGDFKFKSDQSRTPATQKVSCVPEILHLTDVKKGDYLMLACDAIFDEISSVEFADRIVELIAAVEEKDSEGAYLADVAAKFLGELLNVHRSTDNMTVLIVEVGADGTAYTDEPKRLTHLPKTLPTNSGRESILKPQGTSRNLLFLDDDDDEEEATTVVATATEPPLPPM